MFDLQLELNNRSVIFELNYSHSRRPLTSLVEVETADRKFLHYCWGVKSLCLHMSAAEHLNREQKLSNCPQSGAFNDMFFWEVKVCRISSGNLQKDNSDNMRT